MKLARKTAVDYTNACAAGGATCIAGAVTYDLKEKTLKACDGKKWVPLNIGGSPSQHYAESLFGGEPVAFFKYAFSNT